jgi:anthranilate synthase component 1
LPRFCGGLVGYLSYEMIRYFEPSVQLIPHPTIPDGIFLLSETLIVFDHAFRKMILISFPDPELEERKSISEAEKRLDDIERLLAQPLPNLPQRKISTAAKFESNISKEQFTKSVRRAKEYIAAGDIFQVVLSQRLTGYSDAEPFAIYRALRRLNPSPYMFYFNFAYLTGDKPLILIGASPEMHVRLENQVATVRPIAGTRPRGKDSQEDDLLEKECLRILRKEQNT